MQWDTATDAGRNQIGPDFGFDQQASLGAEMFQKTPRRAGIVVGQITARDTVAEQADTGFTSGRRHVRQQNAVLRILRLQCAHQWLDRARFPDRHRMQPDITLFAGIGVKPETFRNMAQISALPPAAPQQAQQQQRRCQIQQQRIQQSRSGHCSNPSMAAVTAATSGITPMPPRWLARAQAYKPVAAGSVAQ